MLAREMLKGAHATSWGKKLHGTVSDHTLQAARRGGCLLTYISHFLLALLITTYEGKNRHHLKYQFLLISIVQNFYMLHPHCDDCDILNGQNRS
jgi:hypothetical protein